MQGEVKMISNKVDPLNIKQARHHAGRSRREPGFAPLDAEVVLPRGLGISCQNPPPSPRAWTLDRISGVPRQVSFD